MVEVSVVMPVYNAAPYLKDAIHSILTQTYHDFEFIIVDDGSTDRSGEIIKSFIDARIVFLQQENRGLAYSLNRGIRESSGKYIARMDADDISLSDRLRLQVAFLNHHPEYVAVGSNAIVLDQTGGELYKVKMPTEHEEIISRLPYNPIFFHSSVMYLRSVFLSCGGYNEKIFHFFEDQILWNLMARNGKLYNLSDPLIKYRLTPTGITNVRPRSHTPINKMISKIITGNELSLNDIKYINKLKQARSINKSDSDYYYRLGNVYRNLLGDHVLAKDYYFSAWSHNPINVKVVLKLILSFLTMPSKDSKKKKDVWITLE